MKFAILLAALLMSSPALADWKPIEKIDTYAVSGESAEQLYLSIGAKGPLVGTGGNARRVIAHTNFKLTWQRDYQPQGGACVLKTAWPKLIITYTLPKPAGKLPPALQARWDTFAAGLIAHEKVHGAGIVDMVDKIVAFSTGLTAGIPDEFADVLTKDAAFPKRMGVPEEYGRLVVAIVENPMLNGSTIRLDAGQRFAPK